MNYFQWLKATLILQAGVTIVEVQPAVLPVPVHLVKRDLPVGHPQCERNRRVFGAKRWTRERFVSADPFVADVDDGCSDKPPATEYCCLWAFLAGLDLRKYTLLKTHTALGLTNGKTGVFNAFSLSV